MRLEELEQATRWREIAYMNHLQRGSLFYASSIFKKFCPDRRLDRNGIQLANAIGVANPISISVDTYGTGKVSEEKLVAYSAINSRLRKLDCSLSVRLLEVVDSLNFRYTG